MECQLEKLEHFRPIHLFEFVRRTKAAEAATNIYAVYGDNTIGESTARKCFSRLKEDCFEISDSSRSGRPSGFDEDCLNTLVHNDPRQCTRELVNVTIPPSCDIYIQWARLKNWVCGYRMR